MCAAAGEITSVCRKVSGCTTQAPCASSCIFTPMRPKQSYRRADSTFRRTRPHHGLCREIFIDRLLFGQMPPLTCTVCVSPFNWFSKRTRQEIWQTGKTVGFCTVSSAVPPSPLRRFTGSLTVSFSFFAAYRFIGRHKSGSSTMQAARPSAMGLAVWTARMRSPSVSSSQTIFRTIFIFSAPACPRTSKSLPERTPAFPPSCGPCC